jgi:hypothetical protein
MVLEPLKTLRKGLEIFKNKIKDQKLRLEA